MLLAAMETKHLYSFGPFKIDPAKRLLRRDQKTIPLPTKAFETLLFLIRHSDRLVEKDELMSVLWPDTTVEENNLSQSISAIRKALGDSPQESHYIETVPGWGYRFAAPVQTIADEGSPVVAIEGTSFKPPPTVKKALIVTLALALIGLTGASLYFRFQRLVRPIKSGGAAQTVSRRSVAVLGFDNLSQDKRDEWLSTALSEMLRTELVAGGNLRIVSGDDTARIKTELPVNRTRTLTGQRLAGLDQKLGSDVLIYGSYVAIGSPGRRQLRLDVRLENAKSGEMISEIAETGAASDLFDLVSRAGIRLRRDLGVSGLSPTEVLVVRASLPTNTQAAEAYSEGLASLRVYDAIHARDKFLQSIAFAPNYPLAHSGLAEAWARLGYDSKASEEAGQGVPAFARPFPGGKTSGGGPLPGGSSRVA